MGINLLNGNHIVRYSQTNLNWRGLRGAKRSFSPDGVKIRLGDFQKAYYRRALQLSHSLNTIQRFIPAENIRVGGKPLSEFNHTATCFYDNRIDPDFLAQALNSIENKAKDLAPCLDHIQLKNLGKAGIDAAYKNGTVKPQDIGPNFALFSEKPIQKRIEILHKLGVIVLLAGKELPQLTPPPKPFVPNPPQRIWEHRPPIKHVKPTNGNQLSLFVEAPDEEDL